MYDLDYCTFCKHMERCRDDGSRCKNEQDADNNFVEAKKFVACNKCSFKGHCFCVRHFHCSSEQEAMDFIALDASPRH